MSDPQSSPAIDPAVQDLIRRKARKLSRLSGFHRQDERDLAQELLTKLLERLARLESGREHLAGFIKTLLKQVAANVVRDRYAAKRDQRKVRPLDATGEALSHARGRGPDAADAGDGDDAHLGGDTAAGDELADLRADVAAVLAELPPDLRELAGRLMYDSPAEVARATGTARSTLQYRVRQLREVFENKNLRDYL